MTLLQGDGVSVIIPVRDATQSLGRQLRALAQQIDAPPFEVTLVDNGRNGNLAARFREDAAQLTVRVADATSAPGTAFARNVGIGNTTAPKLLFCDADDVVGPTWVRDGAAALDEVPVFSGGAVPFTPAELSGPLEDVWGLLAQRLPGYVEAAADMPAGTYPVLLGCSFGARRSVLLELGGFDEGFGSQAEDNDLAFRAQKLLGTLPRAAHVAVAYRIRPGHETSLRRAFSAGFAHAELCARHDAWHLSPSRQGRWVLRPLKEIVTGRGVMSSRADVVGRLVGLVAGRAWFTLVRPTRARSGSSCRADHDTTSRP